MVPSQKCFEATNRIPFEIYKWLIKKLEFAGDISFTKICFQSAAFMHFRVHLRLEKAKPTSTMFFGSIKSHIGVLQQNICIHAIIRRNRDANASANNDFVVVHVERRQ
jgi:hypothetical protein